MGSADRLIDIFTEAKACATQADRVRFADEACADDAELKQQVLSLLEVNDRAGTFLQPPAALNSIKLDHYELLEEVARGGMGVVYKARQLSLNRIVAVKMILSGQFAGKEERLRFRAEAESAAKLQHPNIVRIHETGEVDGRPYFSMDYVEGGSLADLVRHGPLSAKRTAAYVKKIAEAIHYAHEEGILHRDLKPSNVLIDHHDELRITDFGLAKSIQAESLITLTGQSLGSPSFMPPEQVGAKGKTGRYSDVYGIGAILFYLLTARPPFQAETTDATLHQVAHDEPRAPRSLNQLVPLDLETICLKCLAKEAARRYQTALEVAQELGRFLNDEPILTPAALWTDFRQTLWANSEYTHGFAEQADRIIPDRRYLFHVAKSFIRHFAPSDPLRICDLGCGDGSLAEEMLATNRNMHVTLVDGHEGILAAAARRLKRWPETAFIHATFDEIIQGRSTLGTFDFVISSFAIHHLTQSERAALFYWLNEHIIPGGWFMNMDLVLPDQSSLTDWQFELWHEWIVETEKHRLGDGSLQSSPDHARQNPDNKYGSLAPQLNALRAAGFGDVDCIYRNGLFAIYCGRKLTNHGVVTEPTPLPAKANSRTLSVKEEDLRIGLIGDYHPEITAHRAITRSFEIACLEKNTRRITTTWLGTDTMERMFEAELKTFDGFWCVPGSPYASMAGALRGIQFAREHGVPFLGTCAGFQHALIEYARNALGIADADHAETNPEAACVVITRLACPLVEKASDVVLGEGSRLRAIFGRATSTEQYHCNFGLAPDYEALLPPGDFRISARDHNGNAHAIEIVRHPFFIATLFQPERAALRGEVHPLVRAFIDSVASVVASNRQGTRPSGGQIN